jgi:very-long-chain (3R)-3-hydroxyacyl-CoA dehydratase
VYLLCRYNIAFDYYIACLLIIVGYLPGLPKLYGYMLVQRKKQLSGSAPASEKKRA